MQLMDYSRTFMRPLEWGGGQPKYSTIVVIWLINKGIPIKAVLKGVIENDPLDIQAILHLGRHFNQNMSGSWVNDSTLVLLFDLAAK